MNSDWRFIFYEDAMTFMLQLMPRERERLLRALGNLIAEPFRKPDACAHR